MSSSKKIIISNLDQQISSEDVRKHFKDCGEIIKISSDKKGDKNIAIISIIGEDALEKALAKENTYIKESKIHVEELVTKFQQKKQIQKKKKINDDNSDSLSSFSDDSDCSDQNDKDGYAAFMAEYKNYYKNTKRNLKSRVKSLQTNINDPSNQQINVADMLNEANKLYLSVQYDKAIELLHKIISVSPILQEPFQILSQIYEEKGDIQKALSFLMLAAQVSNGDKDIWIRCANYNRQIKNLQQAEYCITRALKLEKRNRIILFERASLNEEMGNLHKAARIYETMLSIYPNIEILIHTAHIHEKLNNYDKGITLLEKYYKIINQRLQCLILLFDFYIKNREYERGVKLYNEINTKEYENVLSNSDFQLKRLFCFLYIVLKYKGDQSYLTSLGLKDNSEEEIINEILLNFKSLINMETYNKEVTDNLHKLFYLLQSIDQIGLFISIFDEIEKISNDLSSSHKMELTKFNPEIFSKIGEYFSNKHNYQKSIDYYIKCLEAKNDDLIRVKLSELYGKINQNEKALEILSRGFNKTDTNENMDTHSQKSFSDIEKENDLYNDNNYITSMISDQISEEQHNNDNNGNNNINNDYVSRPDEDDDFQFYNELTIENKAIGIPTVFSNEYFHPSSQATTKHLGNKRLKISSHVKKNDKIVINYNFDNYLHSKIRKLTHSTNRSRSLSNASNTYQTLGMLKNEFDELSNEVRGMRNAYVKLQQSLVFLNANEISKFCMNTFEPLQLVLLQEVKIENYKTDLFNYILEKSLIKNYFYKKTSIFDQNDIEEEDKDLPLKEALKPYSERTYDDNIELNEDDDMYVEKKDNLFVRKTANKYFLTKKKVAPTITLVEKELENLENVEKFISPENFFRLIEQFIIHSYNNKKYSEAYTIIALLFNSRNFVGRNDYFSYNLFLYGIMSSYNIRQFKISFELMKRDIVRYYIQDIPFFWMQLWNIGKMVPAKIARTFMYKLYLNKNLSSNVLLKLIVASCYFQTNNYDFALNIFNELVNKVESPYIYFMISLCHLYQILNRNSKNKEIKYIKAIRNLNQYTIKRMKSDPIEVAYNLGRYFQFMGHDRLAYQKYCEAYTYLSRKNCLYTEEKRNKVRSACAYNMAMIMKKGGNDEEAHKFLFENIII